MLKRVGLILQSWVEYLILGSNSNYINKLLYVTTSFHFVISCPCGFDHFLLTFMQFEINHCGQRGNWRFFAQDLLKSIDPGVAECAGGGQEVWEVRMGKA